VSEALSVGDRVEVRRAFPPGHIRTPVYIRGKSGVVERVLAVFPDAEERAFGRSGLPGRRLYRVRFLQRELWPDYRGGAADTVDVEVYEHWLQPQPRD
jgi:nitrile hydratase subunit beta